MFGIAEVSKKWYDSLPADLQQIVNKDATSESMAINPQAIEINDRARKAWMDGGGELISLPADEQSAMLKTLASVAAGSTEGATSRPTAHGSKSAPGARPPRPTD